MPSPTSADIKAVDVPLTNYSHALIQDEQKFSARRIFGRTPVAQRSDRYYTYTLGDFHRTDARRREPSSVAPTVGYRLSTDTFYCQPWSVRAGADDMDVANADPVIDLAMDNTQRVTHDLLIRQELDFITAYFGTGIWGTDTNVSGGDQWENAGSTPIETIRGEMFALEAATGFMGNTLVLGSNAWKRLLDHPDIVDRVKSGNAVTTRQLVAQILGIDELFVLNAVRNTAVEGATASMARMEGNHALILYVDRSNGPKVPTAGRNFVWSGFAPGAAGDQGIAIRRYREEAEMTDFVEGISAYDFKVTGSDLGRFLNTAVGS